MVQNKNIDDLLAIGRLYEFSSSKRFHLIEKKFLEDEIGKKAIEINQKIKNSQGIDLFEAISENDLLQYEQTLNQYTTVQSKIIVENLELGDEIELLKLQKDFSKEKLSSHKISVNSFLKSLLKRNKLIIPDVVNFCKSADSISIVLECASIFAVKKFKNKLFLFHLIFEDPEKTYEDNKGGISRLNPDDLLNMQGLRVVMIFEFNINEYQNLLYYPVRLFIKGLDLFSSPVKLGNKIQKFHYNYFLPVQITNKDLDNYLDNLEVPFMRKGDYTTIWMYAPSRIQGRLIFLYVVNRLKLRI